MQQSMDESDLEDQFLLNQGRAIFKTLISVLIILLSINIAYILLYSRYPNDGLPVIWICGDLLSGVSLWLIMRNRVRLGISIFIWSIFILISLAAYTISGLHTPGLYALPFLLMVTIVMLGRRQGILMSSLTLLVIWFLAWLQHSGRFATKIERPVLDQTLSLTLVIAMTALLCSKIAGSLWSQYAQVVATQRKLELELEQRLRSEMRFMHLFSNNPLPSVITDMAGIVRDVNLAWVSTFGIERSAIIGHTTRDFGLWADDSLRINFREQLSLGQTITGRRTSFRTANGVIRHFLVSLAVTEFVDGPGIIANLLDQTERLASEDALQTLNETLEQRVNERTSELNRTVAALKITQNDLLEAEKMASLGSMVAGISHELNTPIGSAVTLASTLHDQVHKFILEVESGKLKKSELIEFLNHNSELSDLLLKCTARASELILSFKQIAIDQTSERRRDFMLDSLIEDVVSTLQPNIKRLPIEIQVDAEKNVHCDTFPGPLGQILANLVLNAVTHAFGNTEPGTILVEAHRLDGERIELTVSDNGCGMSSEVLIHVFDPFFTTRLGQGGSGLGLAVCQRIAGSVLGGSLTVKSTLGKGSQFTLIFPMTAKGKM